MSFRAKRSEAEESRENTLRFARGCLDFARHDERKPETFRFTQHDSATEGVSAYTSTKSPPVRRRKASTYFAELFSITSFGRRGAGGVLSQSSVSR